ncbi:MAG: LysM peptidoglycan-binding domain-containing protein, partial [Candidatus Krumholzibacteria bacterium]|nr:LysM peptidoglycan-binding domain-containing protein [Candidatus Krumholzibacteria bacterium]
MTIGEAPLDTIQPVVLTDEPIVMLPVGPDGYATLENLEGLCDTALALAGQGEINLAQDHLFTLQWQANLPLPAGADSSYAAHVRSLDRRVWLLGGILAEQASFEADPAAADSLLTANYGRLAQADFPDSLVPATGVTLPGFTADLMKLDNQAVRKWENYFTGRGRRNFQFWLDRTAGVDSLVTSILAENGLPTELIYLAMIESGMNFRAVSSVSAVGPWQFMAGTAKDYGLRRNWWFDERRDIEMSTRAAARYIKYLHDRFGDWALVLAAYNSGAGRVARKISQHGHDNFWKMRLPTQTTDYVPKFIAAARIGQDPEKYGFQVRDITSLGYDVLPVDDATDLELIARCAGVRSEEVRQLNPALLRGASPPDMKGYPVRVPKGTGSKARKALRRVPADKRLTWRRHRVERGETLGHIARDFGTSVNDIAKLNKLGDVHLIRPGDQLLIPMPAELANKARARASEKGHYVPPDGYVRVSYKVKSGDTLGGVARKLGVSLNHIRKVNNIYRTSLIHPGQR